MNILGLLTVWEVEKLPEEILKCKAIENFTGWKDKGGYCHWWLRSPGYGSFFSTIILEDGRINYYGDDVDDVLNAVRPILRLESDIPNLIKDEEGYVVCGKLWDGTNIKWLDISEYLDKPVLLMKECIPEACRFDQESNDYENSEIQKFLEELEYQLFVKNMFTDNSPQNYFKRNIRELNSIFGTKVPDIPANDKDASILINNVCSHLFRLYPSTRALEAIFEVSYEDIKKWDNYAYVGDMHVIFNKENADKENIIVE